MKLADLQLAMELQQRLKALDDVPAAEATLSVAGQAFALSADDVADFCDWRRRRIAAALRLLGVDTEDGQPAEAAMPQPAAPMPAAEPAPARRPAAKVQKRTAPAAAGEPAKKRLSLEQARAEARRRILGPIEAQLRKNGGYLDDPGLLDRDLAVMAEKRAGDIEAMAQELLRGPRITPCCRCDLPSNTVIAGQPYCGKHAKTAPRLGLPEPAAELAA